MFIGYRQTADHDLVQRQWIMPFLYLMVGLIIGMTIIGLSWPLSLAVLIGPAVLVAFILNPQFGLYAFFTMIILMTEYFPDTASGKNMFIFNDADTIQGLPSPLILSLLMMFSIFFAWRYFVEKKPSVIPLKYLAALLVVLILAVLTGWRRGWDPIDMRVDFMEFVFPALCFYLCANILTDMNRIYRMIGVIFAACVVKSGILGIYYLRGYGIVIGDQVAVTYDPSDLMAFSTMLIVAFALMSKRGIRFYQVLLILAAAAPILFAVLYSYRRGIWIGTVLSVFLYFLMSPWVSKKRIVKGITLFALLLILFGNIDPGGSGGGSGGIINRLSSIFDSGHHSNQHHFLEARQTIQDVSRSPLLGLGLGSQHKPVKYINWALDEQPTGTVHNTWIYIWMKTGLAGVLFFLWAGFRYLKSIGVFLRCNKENQHPVILALVASIGLWLILSIVTPIPDFYHRSFLIMLFAAIVVSSMKILSDSSAGVAGH